MFVEGCKPGSVADENPDIKAGMQVVKMSGVDLSNATFSLLKYVTFRPNFHRFDRFALGLRGHVHGRGAAFSCLRLKWADIVLI